MLRFVLQEPRGRKCADGSDLDSAREVEYMHPGAGSNRQSFMAASQMFKLANVKVTRYESQLKTVHL
jgi:hypothetical protein